jgi:membrane fusion protein (multidrug efflux system)
VRSHDARAGTRIRGSAAGVAALILVAACGHKGGPPAFPPPEVSVVELRPGTVAQSYEFTGAVVSYRRVEVRARVDGIILERTFTEGTVVQAGQVLYRLDRIRPDAAYRSALAAFENAKRTLERLEPLLAQHAVAQQQVDDARSEFAAAQGALQQAKKNLDDTEVRAEIDGRVGRTLLDVGARVTGPADWLTTIDRLDPVYVTFRPSSEQLTAWHEDPRSRALIRQGSPLTVQVALPDGSVLPRSGRLDFVAPALDAATGTQEFRAVFDNGDRLLMPGQFVRVRLVGFARDSALAVPLRAVQSGLGRQFVYVVGAGDTAVVRDVQPGPWSGSLWIIDQGLRPGDRVIVDGTQKVIPGRLVRPVPLDSSASTPPGTDRPGPGR